MPLTRAVAVAVAITAPLTALATLAVERATYRRPRPVLVAEYGIRNVPDRPPLWRTTPAAPNGPIRLADAAPVPPENPHALPTPPHGVRQVR